MQAHTKLMTVDEWLLHDVPEGFRVELVDGVLEMTPLAANRHQRVLANLIDEVSFFKRSHPGVIAWWGSPCRFPIRNIDRPRGREPDLGIYDRNPPDIDDPLAWKQVLPIIVAEVVSADPGEAYRDHVEKRRDYHDTRIPEYWIVDFRERLFLALRRTEHGWDEHHIQGQGTYSTPLLPGFELQVSLLWT